MNQTNFFKMLGRIKKGEIATLNVGTLKKIGKNEYLLELKQAKTTKPTHLTLKYNPIGSAWHWIGGRLKGKRIYFYDLKCKRHEILKVLFEILGVDIEELEK
jgi:hypothetical protein